MANKCTDCGHKLALATAYCFNCEVGFDEEPYKPGVEEPVVVDGETVTSIDLCFSVSCHVCPRCGWMKDFVTEDHHSDRGNY